MGTTRRTANGGVNQFGDYINDVQGGVTGWDIAVDTFGNSVSDMFGLDTIADSIMVTGDSDQSVGARTWAATKGSATVALDVAGGAILKKGAGLLGRIPGASRLVAWAGETSFARGVSGLLSKKVPGLGLIDELGGAVRTSSFGRFFRRDVGTFWPGRSPAAELERLAGRAGDLQGALIGKARYRTTSAVLSTREGVDVLAQGATRNISGAIEAQFARDGDLVARLTGRRIEILNAAHGWNLPARADAEVTAYVRGIMQGGFTPRGISATQNICFLQCRGFLSQTGADLIGTRGAWWFSRVNSSNFIPLGGLVGQ